MQDMIRINLKKSGSFQKIEKVSVDNFPLRRHDWSYEKYPQSAKLSSQFRMVRG
jgi:hypothetical protein